MAQQNNIINRHIFQIQMLAAICCHIILQSKSQEQEDTVLHITRLKQWHNKNNNKNTLQSGPKVYIPIHNEIN